MSRSIHRTNVVSAVSSIVPSPATWFLLLGIFVFRATMHVYSGIAAPAAAGVGSSTTAAEPPAADKLAAGRKVAEFYCQSCHLFPEPEVLDKTAWKDQVLPRMKIFLGLVPIDYEKSRDGPLLKARGVFPDSPKLPEADWNTIVDYYLATAPTEALPQDPRPEIRIGLKNFKVERYHFRKPTPTTTLIKISPASHRIYVGDDYTQSLTVLLGDGRYLDSIKLGNVPVALTETERGLYVTMIGSFQPTEVYHGGLALLERTNNAFGERRNILSDMPRSVGTEFADFNGDGKIDFAFCMFGDFTGRFSWFENLGNDQYKEHVLINKAGAVRCVAYDFNRDGFPDLAVLMAQELESLFIFLNDGKGNFTGQTVFQKPPVYGHNYFEIADFNKDGLMDFLVTNGDNGEYESPIKKYHGIRIYQNMGNIRFEEVFFYPMNGAIKAVARDYDGDGDLDIAAISFFPDYKKSPRESFVYLENLGGNRFSASTFRECISGRWLTMDVGDLDGDGDLDIVLGSYIKGPTSVPDFLMNMWETNSPSALVLRNTLH